MEQTIRIFLADASQDYLDLMRAELEQQPDFTVVGTAKNGAEALELLSARKPDVLVSDLLLPGLDGLSLMRRLKDAEKLDGFAGELKSRGEELGIYSSV